MGEPSYFRELSTFECFISQYQSSAGIKFLFIYSVFIHPCTKLTGTFFSIKLSGTGCYRNLKYSFWEYPNQEIQSSNRYKPVSAVKEIAGVVFFKNKSMYCNWEYWLTVCVWNTLKACAFECIRSNFQGSWEFANCVIFICNYKRLLSEKLTFIFEGNSWEDTEKTRLTLSDEPFTDSSDKVMLVR